MKPEKGGLTSSLTRWKGRRSAVELPQVALIDHRFDPQKLEDIPAEVSRELRSLRLSDRITPGDTVAITAGSRGVNNIGVITKTLVDELKRLGARPFIFSSMGSHGGATAEGQRKVLEVYGITEDRMGCPILSTMEVTHLGNAEDGLSIYVDKYAMEADHIVVVNRIKPHTKFEGPIESGLMKMMAIGMGNHKGAQYYHKAAVQLTFQRIVDAVGREILRKCPILCGLAIVENGYDQTAVIKAFLPEEIPDGEKDLLVIAKERMARLPFTDIDVLVIDEIGKDISGTGMDINVTGRNRDILGDYTATPRVGRIFVRDLTEETEGNALGIGLADFTTTRAVEKMNREKTYINCLTAISPEKGAIPMYFDTDREALEACFGSIGDIPCHGVRLVHIKNTLHLSKISVSRAFEEELARNHNVERISEWNHMALDHEGNIISPFD
jgi:hypothetical protein